jgi:hypothetical protein
MRTIKINTIEFESNSEDILLKVQITEKKLSYQSMLNLPMQSLNKILNILQKQNSSINIYDFIDNYVCDHQLSYYKINLEKLINSEIKWDELTHNHFFKQIRA